MLPPDVSAYVTMHSDMPAFASFEALKRFAFKYIKTLRSLGPRARKAAHLVEDSRPPPLMVEQEDEEALTTVDLELVVRFLGEILFCCLALFLVSRC